jgi:hypothetical protein
MATYLRHLKIICVCMCVCVCVFHYTTCFKAVSYYQHARVTAAFQFQSHYGLHIYIAANRYK